MVGFIFSKLFSKFTDIITSYIINDFTVRVSVAESLR